MSSDETVDWSKEMVSESSGDMIPDEKFQKLLAEILAKDRAILEDIGRL